MALEKPQLQIFLSLKDIADFLIPSEPAKLGL
jgi:hypothetical protein